MTTQIRLDPRRGSESDQTPHGISYSDGDEVEDYLYSVLRNAVDLSAASSELAAAIKDWPSEYHLSPRRHNLLRHLELKSTDRVLELGCGCGAITRFLGETGATIIALEGSPRRAKIAAERCRDLPNVSVRCGNIADFRAAEKFDFVTLIGVLEYAPRFIEADDPVGACIGQAESLLKEEGSLILAIENQLGLKYLNGCAEDHAGVPYYGVQDLYGAGTAVTFGKRELESRLGAAGLSDVAFMYPFPDYKLPSIVLTSEAFERPDFKVADLLYRSFSRDYSGGASRAFHENLVWQPLARNGLLQDHANSFLVTASRKRPGRRARIDWFARTYSAGRLPAYETETLFRPDGNGIAVVKRQLFQSASPPDHMGEWKLRHRPAMHASYVSGQLYATKLQPIMARGGGPEAVARWAAPWVERLLAESLLGPDGKKFVPGARLDALPSNLVRDSSGTFFDIDLEWEAGTPVPLAWVLTRGLVNSIGACPASPAFNGLTFREGVIKILENLGLVLSEEDFRTAAAFEDALQDMVSGQDRSASPYSALLNGPIYSFTFPTTFHDEIAGLRVEIAALRAEIIRVKASSSWRLSAPFRVAYNFARKIGRG
ncbi:bifunctional 2-polyprenyl-6-hydroxyphenol methylase/3-demethylubiquinol 3-O-methyltransferase UbiG [Ramlibacter sp. WS9]|uniref:class I SAM-dependent methyltransferase n=1 Tax=Ramlibacter sp. WS9 TaxID=1882741 RepID=UPI0011414501|nr:class I SAM-dependent methyltransferase [Ramlibacter sp. WS9]ROZ79131.1 methyltransferase domain-containing protein [Ramlibacter sp. WS9]